jgi:tRNA-dihydrouridine synthase B
MLGRGAMGNPWLFSRALAVLAGQADPGAPDATARVAMLRRHVKHAYEHRGTHALAEMRKHAMWYLKGLPSAAERRAKLNATMDFAEVLGILDEYAAWLQAHPEAVAAERGASFAETLEEAV